MKNQMSNSFFSWKERAEQTEKTGQRWFVAEAFWGLRTSRSDGLEQHADWGERSDKRAPSKHLNGRGGNRGLGLMVVYIQ